MEAARILIADDDEWVRQSIKRVMVREGYTVLEATDGADCLRLAEIHRPDVVLLDAVMPVLDGFSVCAQLQRLRGGIPVLMITSLEDSESVDRAFEAGASEFLTKPLHWAVLRQRVKRIIEARRTEGQLQAKVEQLDILHRIDRELGYTMNIERVLDLAGDTALRLSGAAACIIGWVEEETQQLEPLTRIGQSSILAGPVLKKQLPETDPLLASVFETNAPFHYHQVAGRQSQLILPLMAGQQAQGMIVLDDIPDLLDKNDLQFLLHLASRTAAAIERTRTYHKARVHANWIDNLYIFSTAISSQLSRDSVIELLTRGLAVLLKASSAFFCAYDERANTLIVQNRFVVAGVSDTPPAIGATYPMAPHVTVFSELATPLTALPTGTHEALQGWYARLRADSKLESGLVIPIVYEDSLLGLVVIGESRFERYFHPDEVNLVHSLAAHGAIALQHATLFKNMQELERVKSDMIRMISHDLRNPLGQISAYFDLLVDDLRGQLADNIQGYVTTIKRAIRNIERLLFDILSLERVESQQPSEWEVLEIQWLLEEVIEDLAPQAQLKQQVFLKSLQTGGSVVRGNRVQLRQAFTNLIDNAIKFTPSAGRIEVRGFVDEQGRFQFAVQDSGVGIHRDHQKRLFERFYRVSTPETEDIEGTGLGLSLVKSIVERHYGQVWFESEAGVGSTFGFSLPTHDDETT